MKRSQGRPGPSIELRNGSNSEVLTPFRWLEIALQVDGIGRARGADGRCIADIDSQIAAKTAQMQALGTDLANLQSARVEATGAVATGTAKMDRIAKGFQAAYDQVSRRVEAEFSRFSNFKG